MSSPISPLPFEFALLTFNLSPQAKLLKTYKRYSLAVDSFDNSMLPDDIEAIDSEKDLVRLRDWSEQCRQKWSLVRRVIVARAEHHQQFYAGGDWGHCLFVESLYALSLFLSLSVTAESPLLIILPTNL